MIPCAYPLKEVVFHENARGPWCATPYHNHPEGCPNFIKGCTFKRTNFNLLRDKYNWIAVVEEFDLCAHAAKMKEKCPTWTDRQCRNLLYWQKGVHARLLARSKECAAITPNSIILDIPEAHGVEVFETMKRAGVIIERNHPETVKKVMLVGVPK